MVVMASFKNMNGEINYSGVALVMTMARYFKRWSLWSKDILFVITSDSTAGPQAWVSAYHSEHDPTSAASLSLKAGALQGAIALDYAASPAGHRFDKLHIHYDGMNGQLPNLDLLNTLVHIARNQVGITSMIQNMQFHSDSYFDRLKTLFRGVLSQGASRSTGPHSAFMTYHVDAVTLQTVGDGWHDEMSLGMVVESGVRSINNLLEKLHQSFFFYLLLESERFVSIGTYLPSAMLVAGSFTITSVALWLQSGKPSKESESKSSDPISKDPAYSHAKSMEESPVEKKGAGVIDEKSSISEKRLKQQSGDKDTEPVEKDDAVALVPLSLLSASERRVALPITLVALTHFLGLIPLYLFDRSTEFTLLPLMVGITFMTLILPLLFAAGLHDFFEATPQQQTLISCFSLLILGITLSTLSTLNFSLGLLIGLASAPLNFVSPLLPKPSPSTALNKPTKSGSRDFLETLAVVLAQLLTAPTTLIILIGIVTATQPVPGLQGFIARSFNGVKDFLLNAKFAWHVNGSWTAVVLWVVWWPAWILGTTVTVGRFLVLSRTTGSTIPAEGIKVGDVIVKR